MVGGADCAITGMRANRMADHLVGGLADRARKLGPHNSGQMLGAGLKRAAEIYLGGRGGVPADVLLSLCLLGANAASDDRLGYCWG